MVPIIRVSYIGGFYKTPFGRLLIYCEIIGFEHYFYLTLQIRSMLKMVLLTADELEELKKSKPPSKNELKKIAREQKKQI